MSNYQNKFYSSSAAYPRMATPAAYPYPIAPPAEVPRAPASGSRENTGRREVPRPAAPAKEWSVMDDSMALVACGGKYVPATEEQLAIITMGEDATDHMQMFEDYRIQHGKLEYVICAGGRKRFIKNLDSGKCRLVVIVPNPKAWTEDA